MAIFVAWGAIDWRLGVPLSAAAFFGGMLGARATLVFSEVWLRRIFVGVVLILAFKTLVFDVEWSDVL